MKKGLQKISFTVILTFVCSFLFTQNSWAATRVDQANTNINTSVAFGRGTTNILKTAASFVPTQNNINQIGFQRWTNVGTGPTGTITLSIQSDTNGNTYSGNVSPSSPSGNILWSKTYTPAQWNALSTTNGVFTIEPISPYLTLSPDSWYWIVFELPAGNADSTNYPYLYGGSIKLTPSYLSTYTVSSGAWNTFYNNTANLGFITYYDDTLSTSTMDNSLTSHFNLYYMIFKFVLGGLIIYWIAKPRSWTV